MQYCQWQNGSMPAWSVMLNKLELDSMGVGRAERNIHLESKLIEIDLNRWVLIEWRDKNESSSRIECEIDERKGWGCWSVSLNDANEENACLEQFRAIEGHLGACARTTTQIPIDLCFIDFGCGFSCVFLLQNYNKCSKHAHTRTHTDTATFVAITCKRLRKKCVMGDDHHHNKRLSSIMPTMIYYSWINPTSIDQYYFRHANTCVFPTSNFLHSFTASLMIC